MDYERVYRQFIADRLTRQPVKPAYFEKHHIKPRSLGGGDEKSNIIRLSAEDHIFAHLLLARWLGTKQMWAAIKFIFGQSAKSRRTPTRREIRIAADARMQFALRNGGANNPNYGVAMAQEQKDKLRAANLGKRLSDQHKLAISAAHIGNSYARGVKHSDETRRKVALANTGRKHTAETKAKIAAAHAGRAFSESHRDALSAAKVGRPAPHLHTTEIRAKRGAALKGRLVSAETRAKQSESRMGKVASTETRLKMSGQRAGAGNARAKPVTCLCTGETFGCVKDAAEHFKLSHSTLRAALNRGAGQGLVGGFRFRTL